MFLMLDSSKLRIFLHKCITLEQAKQVHVQLVVNRHNHLEPILVHHTLHHTKVFSRNVISYVKRILKSDSDSFSWGCLVRFLSQHRKFQETVSVYIEMHSSGVPPNSHSMTSVLRACGKTENIHGYSVHAQAIKTGLYNCLYVQTGLVGMYSRLGYIDMAKRAFDEIPLKNTVTWNSLLQGYLETENLNEARNVFNKIPEKDVVSYNLMISSYVRKGDMKLAESLFIAMPFKSSASWRILIGGYVNAGEIEQARNYFDAMPKKDKLVYDVMISCYARNGKPNDALKLFSQMLGRKEGIKPDEITLSSVVSANSQLGNTSFGGWVESYVAEHGIHLDDLLSTSLIDLYLKGGDFTKAFRLFDNLNQKDTVSYSAMIMGCGRNGMVKDADRLFKEMIEKKITPNVVTFTGLLSAYSHSGLVQEGEECFESMKDYDLEPSVDHYGIMVDMLGRAGRLKEAYELIKSMPMQPNVGVWGALLLASGLHNNVEFGEIACRRCVELEESNPSGYLSRLANIYTSVGRWNDARNVREAIGESKTLGCSWLEQS